MLQDTTGDTHPDIYILFGVLFSGVTGILAGANLSGELKDPSKSIPKGTIGGTFFTFVTYFVLFLLTAYTCNRELLYHECMYMFRMDFWGPTVCIGRYWYLSNKMERTLCWVDSTTCIKLNFTLKVRHVLLYVRAWAACLGLVEWFMQLVKTTYSVWYFDHLIGNMDKQEIQSHPCYLPHWLLHYCSLSHHWIIYPRYAPVAVTLLN